MALTIGIDVGTQGVKGIALDPTQSTVPIARASRSLRLIDGLPPGAAEQHPEDWWQATCEVIDELLATDRLHRNALKAIGVSGQQHGSVFLDENDAVIRPAKLWCDTSTVAEARAISEMIGQPLPVGYTASKIRWLAQVEPENWRRTDVVLLPHDFINLRLTGHRAMEAGDASGTGYFDPSRRDWDPAIVAVVADQLESRLPPLAEPDVSIGTISPAVADRFDLPKTVQVSPGGGDNMMSAIGAGATRPGIVVTSLGTSATVFTRSDQPVIDRTGAIAPFCSSDGAWLPLLCTMNCTNVTEEVRTAFQLSKNEDLEELTALASQIQPGCDGLSFIPFLVGERVPDLPQATGVIEGLTPGSLRPAPLFRAALEGVTINLSLGVDRLRELGISFEEVRLVGGGSKNSLWRTLVADLFDARVTIPLESESAALGAALQSQWIVAREENHDVSIDQITEQCLSFTETEIYPDRERQASLKPVRDRYRRRIEQLLRQSNSP